MKNAKLFIGQLHTIIFKRLVIFSILLLTLSSCNTKEIDFEKRIDIVKTAINQKKIDSLKPYLANGYTIKGLPEGMESMILPIMIEKLPSQKKFIITSNSKEKRGTRIKVTFYDTNNTTIKSNFLIAKDGKFLELNILEDAKINTEIEK